MPRMRTIPSNTFGKCGIMRYRDRALFFSRVVEVNCRVCTLVIAQCGNFDGLLTGNLQDAPTKPLPHQLAEADSLY